MLERRRPRSRRPAPHRRPRGDRAARRPGGRASLPARPARAIRRASGSTSSGPPVPGASAARAPRGVGGRPNRTAATRAARRRTRRRSRRPAIRARLGARRRPRDADAAAGPARGDEGADGDRPRPSRARRGRGGAGIPIEPWQQVIADAAVGRTLIGVAGTHGKSTIGRLARPRPRVRPARDPAAFVGALLPAGADRRRPGDGPAGRGSGRSSSRPTSTPATSTPTGRRSRSSPRPSGTTPTSSPTAPPSSPRSIAGCAAPRTARRRRAARRASSTSRTPGAAELAAGLRDWPGTIVATALVDADGSPASRAIASRARRAVRDRGRAGPGAARPDRRQRRRTRRRSRSTASTIGPGPLTGPPPDRRPPQRGQRPRGRRRRRSRAGSRRTRSWPASASFGGVGRRLERKGEAGGVVVFDDYGHHPTAIRETLAAVRQRAPGRRDLGRLRAADLPPDRRPARRLRRGPRRGRRASRSPTSGPAATRTRRSRRPPGWRRPSPPATRAIPVAAPGSVEATAAWLAGEVRPGDAVLVMGGGRSYRIGELLLEALADR